MHLDWGSILHVEWNLAFFLAFLNIMFIDLILSGDNAVLIAMAVHNLPKNQRMKGIAFGTVGAIILRVIFTFFVALLLEIRFLKLTGGALILWIAFKLLTETSEEEDGAKHGTTLWHAIRLIIIADLTMALDNMLAVAGAAGENLLLLLIGFCMSIPLVIGTSKLLSNLMDKYPIIIMIGGAILGKVGTDMIMTDPFVRDWLHPSATLKYTVEVLGAIGVIVISKLWIKWQFPKTTSCETVID